MSTRAQNCRDVAVLLGVYKTHNLEDIKEGIRKFYEEHGRPPFTTGGDATGYVGYRTTWSRIVSWLHKNKHASLPRLVKEMGLDPFHAPHNLEDIKGGIRKYYDEHGRPPSENGGDARRYVGYRTTWLSVKSWLKKGGHGSLPRLIRKMGLKPLRAPHTLESVKGGIRKYYDEHGRPPSERGGDATRYVGYETTWACVKSWLDKRGYASLPRLAQEMGLRLFQADHNLESIEDGVRKYYEEHGRPPSSSRGDAATQYVGYRTTWACIDSWLRRRKKISLSWLAEKKGFGPLRAPHNLEDIKEGIQKYYDEHGRYPTAKRGGDATRYMGYRTTWGGVAAWLTAHGYGSLPQLAKRMGLSPIRAPHNLEDIKEGIRKFYEEHGRPPFTTGGDATGYLGYRTTWSNTDSWLRTAQKSSLPQLAERMRF